MKNYFFIYKNKLIHFFYVFCTRPIFFKIDPEMMHHKMVSVGQWLGKNKFRKKMITALFNYSNANLMQTINGIIFDNPIGLAAGFDKNAVLTDIMPSVGFGFVEVGTITAQAYVGNPQPRLTRLKKSKAIVVNYGLANEGARTIYDRLKTKTFAIPIGISVGPTNCITNSDPHSAIADYIKTITIFNNTGSYFTLNISCPNTRMDQPFIHPYLLDQLLKKVMPIVTKPVFIKLSPDLDFKKVDQIIKVAQRHHVAGFICGNLTKNRNNPKIKDRIVPNIGGISGKPTQDLSDALIAYIYKTTRGSMTLIGCGGIFSAEDAYKKIKLGASLIQLITGMIYEGPQLIGAINYGLVELLKKDGYSQISQAVGRDIQK